MPQGHPSIFPKGHLYMFEAGVINYRRIGMFLRIRLAGYLKFKS